MKGYVYPLFLVILLIAIPAMGGVMPPSAQLQGEQLPLTDVYGQMKQLGFESQVDDWSVPDNGFNMMMFTPTPTEGIYYTARRGMGTVAYFGASIVYHVVNDVMFTVEFLGSNEVVPVGESPTGSVTNYMLGNDPHGWSTGLQDCSILRYTNMYQGIDLVYKFVGGQLKYEFIVAPNADPSVIRLWYRDAETVDVDNDTITAWRGTEAIIDAGLMVFQRDLRDVHTVDCVFERDASGSITFSLGDYDHLRELIIDPVCLAYSTYLGGGGSDTGLGIAVEDGFAYVTGQTSSANFPRVNAYDIDYNGGYDAFVMKLSVDGMSLVYSTYLGGSGVDAGYGISVENGFAYITGRTNSVDFPMVNAYDDSFNGLWDAFVTKLDADGQSLMYSTYLGGSGYYLYGDYGEGIAVENGFVYVSGYTWSSNFPTVNSYDPTFNGGLADAFLTKFSVDGMSLVYSTFLGGTAEDRGLGVAVESGFAYVTGWTYSNNYPTLNAYDLISNGWADAFVTKLSADGMSLVYSTYLGGIQYDYGLEITVEDGFAYVTGETSSTNFPRVNAYDIGHNGGTDAFVTKLSVDGTFLVYSTFLGGSGDETGRDIAVEDGFAYVTGQTSSINFPTVDAYDDSNLGNVDAFVTKFAADGTSLMYSTYLGGNGQDTGHGISVEYGFAFVTGVTYASDFPTFNAYNSSHSGGDWDAFVTKLYSGGPAITGPANFTYPESMTGNSITWVPSAYYPASYAIYKNDTQVDSGSWNGSQITADVDGLGVGVYNYTLVVSDIFGNSATDILFVTVEAYIPPTIDSPDDIAYAEGVTGHSITWTPFASHPTSYRVYRNGISVKSGDWNSSSESVTVSVNGYGLGSFNYTIVVTDIGSNMAVDTVFVTVVDGTPPTIDSPADIEYNEFTSGHSITWHQTDLHPSSYVIYLNGNPVKSGAWNISSEIITISVDGHGLGDYNYTLVVADVGGNTATNEVMVTVIDGTAPIIDSPTDFQYNEFTTGHSITWNPTDMHPVSYVIYLEGSPVKSGAWNSSSETISISVDGHLLGEYNYTLVVTDVGGNTAVNEIQVTVVDGTAPNIDTPPDIQYDEFASGYSITWNPTDMHPVSYVIYLEGSPVKSGVWNTSLETISISVDGLSPSENNYTIVVTDVGGKMAIDTVFVYVTDGTAPSIDSPVDIQYDEFDTGYSITWGPTDLHPVSYVVYLEGSPIKSGAWNMSSETITILVDGHLLGEYNYTIVVADVGGNTAIDTVFVYVTDGTAPIIDTPVDIQYDEFATGYSITWDPSDLHPVSYVVYLEGSPIKSGAWNMSSETITILVDGHLLGEYSYTLVVADVGGNTFTDEVKVTVVDGAAPNIDSHADIQYDEFTIGYSITWNPSDLHPVSYVVYLQGNPIKSGAWNTSSEIITISVDGHVLGEYNYTIVVTDIGSNTATDEVKVTVVDATSPIIDSPDDIEYSEFDIGNMIIWHPEDANPQTYLIYLNDTPVKTGLWNSSSETITISADGLELGVYNYTIIVTDVGGNTARDEVLVIVTDGTAPIIDTPVDIQYDEFATGHSITWDPSDLHPVSYIIYLEGSSVKSGAWNVSSETIIISVDGHGLGDYNYTIVVADVGGNTRSDEVIVTVVDATFPTVDSPADIEYEEFHTGYWITWQPADANPQSYFIYRNDTLVKSGAWNSSSETITVSVDGLDIGVYNYTIVVVDADDNTGTDQIMVMVIDRTIPAINTPSDIQYEEFTTGHSITWSPMDPNPYSYTVYKNDTPLRSGDWNSSSESIIISVDGLGLGEYNYTIVVTDVGGNSAKDEVLVTVVDGTPPTIDSPVDIEYNEFTIGHSITWHPTDLHPSSYVIYLDGSPVKSGAWNSSSETITISVDGHGLGSYNYTIVVTDVGGNTRSDEVLVTVVDGTLPFIDSPADFQYNEFATGYSITWDPSDPHPVSYIIYLDGSPIKSGAWNISSETISVSVDGHELGSHIYTIVVTDVGGNTAIDTVFVYVTDGTAPIIDTPVDIQYGEFATGYSITWDPSDAHPVSYIIYLDGSPIKSGAWNSSSETITISVDGHGLGSYNYTIVVADVGLNMAIDTVFVTVVDGTPPTIDSPAGIEYNEFTIGHSITWHPTDLHPSGYVIYRDGTPVKSGAWNSSSEDITISVDGHGLGTYNYTVVVTDVGGNTARDEVLVTVVDATFPTVDSPADIEYEEFTTGYSITWHPTDVNPLSYIIYLDGTPVKSGAWNSSSEGITVSVDGRGFGTYNYTVVVTDVGGNTARGEVLVTVVDGTVPTVDSPADFQYEEGQTGNVIVWNPDDLHPASCEILKDGNLLRSEEWTSTTEAITVSVDGLAPGVYNYTIVVTDVGGNTAVDVVIVTVTASTTTTSATTTETTTSTTDQIPPPDSIMIIVVVGAGAAGVIVIIFLLMKKRK